MLNWFYTFPLCDLNPRPHLYPDEKPGLPHTKVPILSYYRHYQNIVQQYNKMYSAFIKTDLFHILAAGHLIIRGGCLDFLPLRRTFFSPRCGDEQIFPTTTQNKHVFQNCLLAQHFFSLVTIWFFPRENNFFLFHW